MRKDRRIWGSSRTRRGMWIDLGAKRGVLVVWREERETEGEREREGGRERWIGAIMLNDLLRTDSLIPFSFPEKGFHLEINSSKHDSPARPSTTTLTFTSPPALPLPPISLFPFPP